MSGKRYTDEFKTGAVRQVKVRGFPAAEAAQRLGMTTHSLYAWLKRYGEYRSCGDEGDQAESQRLRSELRRVTEERDILKSKGT